MPVRERLVPTSHAEIAVAETSGDKLPILLIHGNSSCKEVFREQLESPLGDTYRLIAMDLPGHGASSDAVDPERTYSWPGYGEAAIEVLERLGIRQAAVYGWSLGGHAALEMIPRYPGLAGVMISGTPPVSITLESIQTGYRPNPDIALFGKADLTDAEVEALAVSTYGEEVDDHLRQAVRRTDGRARELLFASLYAGKPHDQKKLVEESDVPLAVVDGAEDHVVNTDYVASLDFANLWDDHYYLLRGQGHVAFLAAPEVFNPILGRFLADVDMRFRGVKAPAKRTRAAAAA
jgi:pimeloyl-ACP methyl ester carboxylesterase